MSQEWRSKLTSLLVKLVSDDKAPWIAKAGESASQPQETCCTWCLVTSESHNPSPCDLVTSESHGPSPCDLVMFETHGPSWWGLVTSECHGPSLWYLVLSEPYGS